jgi:hypothetical protein
MKVILSEPFYTAEMPPNQTGGTAQEVIVYARCCNCSMMVPVHKKHYCTSLSGTTSS